MSQVFSQCCFSSLTDSVVLWCISLFIQKTLAPGIRCGPGDDGLTALTVVGSGSPLASLPLLVAGWRRPPCRMMASTAMALVLLDPVPPRHPWTSLNQVCSEARIQVLLTLEGHRPRAWREPPAWAALLRLVELIRVCPWDFIL